MKNRYEGACSVCGANVAAGNGYVFGPPWKTKCALCAGHLDAVKIEAVHEHPNVVFKIHGFLGNRFNEYREACAGAKFDPVRKVNFASMDQALVIIDRLRKGGFVVDLQPGLSAALQAKAAEFKAGLDEAEQRLTEADESLKARGLFLFPFQREGVRWLTNRWGALLADQMGLGKTIQTLLAIPKGAPAVVVSPAVAKGVWKREVAKWRPDLKVTVLNGMHSFRWPEPGEMIILNYDILPDFDPEAPKPETQPFPMRYRNAVSRVEEPFKAGEETTLRFKHARLGDERYHVQVEVSEKVKNPEWHLVAMWDQDTPPEQSEVTLGPKWTTGNPIVTDTAMDERAAATARAFGVEKPTPKTITPKLIRISWSTTASVNIGVEVEKKVAPPPPPPSKDAPKGVVVIADEAHAVKNRKAGRTVLFRQLSAIARKVEGKVWLLTATPLMNKPVELWSILQAAEIEREAFGTWDKFVAAFNGYKDTYSYEWGSPDEEKVTAALRKVSLRRMRKDVLKELPEKMYRQVRVSLDAKTAQACDKAMAVLRQEIPSVWDRLLSDDPTAPGPSTISLDEIEDARSKISRMSGTRFAEMSHAREMLARAKIPALLEMIADFEEQEEPVVVFSAHLSAIDLLGSRPGWAKITGETPAEERTAIEDAFQAGKLKGIAASIKAGGVAITLTRACHAIFLDREWNPALNEQAEDRIMRIGQSRGVVITFLYAEHALDTHVEGLLATKRAIIEASIDASRIRSNETIEPMLLPEVDFAKLAEEAAAEARRADEVKKLAEERLARFTEEKARAVAEGRAVAEEFRPKTAQDEPARRGPRDAREQWAMAAVITLAGLDPDRAAQRNDVGFSASDGGIGHKLASEVVFGLTDKQWDLVSALCTKYWRQVGRPPAIGSAA